MQQSLEREIKALHAWAKKAPGERKQVESETPHVDYTLTVDGVKLAVVITVKQGVITARELAVLDNYKSGGIWKFAYILHITQDKVQYQELAQFQGTVQGNTITPGLNTFKSIAA
jgi:hypothetical protein